MHELRADYARVRAEGAAHEAERVQHDRVLLAEMHELRSTNSALVQRDSVLLAEAQAAAEAAQAQVCMFLCVCVRI
jgi:hypothetical protein